MVYSPGNGVINKLTRLFVWTLSPASYRHVTLGDV